MSTSISWLNESHANNYFKETRDGEKLHFKAFVHVILCSRLQRMENIKPLTFLKMHYSVTFVGETFLVDFGGKPETCLV